MPKTSKWPLLFVKVRRYFFIGGKFYTTVSDKQEVGYIMNYNVGQQIMWL